MMRVFWHLFQDESGVTLVEYAMVLSLLSIGMIVGLTALATAIGNNMTNASTSLTNLQANPPYSPP